jgi:DNA helicase HerA-like ATPase
MLCPSCQDKFDAGEISEYDVEFSKWLLEKSKEFSGLEKTNLLRAIKTDDLLILVVKKKSKSVFTDDEAFLNELENTYGKYLIVEGPAKLRTIVREMIQPAIEVGVNSLYLPNGFKESIVMLRAEDRERINYSKDELRAIVSAVTGESVLFQYQDEGIEKEEEPEADEFGEKLREFSGGRQ